MSAKPNELKKLVALLDEEAPSAEWLAKEVFLLVEELLNNRQRYVVFAVHPTVNVIQAVGPYNTQEQARKDYVKRICAIDNHSFARLALLKHPDSINADGVV
jgi:hypothetical protein